MLVCALNSPRSASIVCNRTGGYGHRAHKSRAESIEEMPRADRFTTRVIFLEGHRNLQKQNSLRIGHTLRETLECDVAAENGARALYSGVRQ